MKKQDKVQLVENLTPKLKASSCVVLVNFAGLSVSLQQKLKAELRGVNSEMVVVKNTLIKLSAKDAGLPQEVITDEVLSGQTALIITDSDAIAPITILGKFAKENNVPQFKVGVVEGLFQDKAGLEKLATLPGRDVLLSQVLGNLMSPSYSLVGVLQGNLQKLMFILKSKAGDNQ